SFVRGMDAGVEQLVLDRQIVVVKLFAEPQVAPTYGVDIQRIADEPNPTVAALNQIVDRKRGPTLVIEDDGVGSHTLGSLIYEYHGGSHFDLLSKTGMVLASRHNDEPIHPSSTEFVDGR